MKMNIRHFSIGAGKPLRSSTKGPRKSVLPIGPETSWTKWIAAGRGARKPRRGTKQMMERWSPAPVVGSGSSALILANREWAVRVSARRKTFPTPADLHPKWEVRLLGQTWKKSENGSMVSDIGGDLIVATTLMQPPRANGATKEPAVDARNGSSCIPQGPIKGAPVVENASSMRSRDRKVGSPEETVRDPVPFPTTNLTNGLSWVNSVESDCTLGDAASERGTRNGGIVGVVTKLRTNFGAPLSPVPIQTRNIPQGLQLNWQVS